ncbi:MAG: aspartate aminotransferase family protein [Bacteroidota bacterium]
MSETLLEQENKFFFHTYKRLPLDIERGEGVFLYGRDGKEYLDFFGGLAVNALGYNHPRVVQAIEKQIRKYNHLSNFFVQEPQVRLAEKLVCKSGFGRIFFSNSGTEAIEGAIKLARKWGKGTKKTQLFGLSNAFHGRTMGALSLMDKAKYRDDYAPFLPNMGSLEFNDIGDLDAKVNEHTLGVFVEPIQGEGGVFEVSPAYARELMVRRDKLGFLIIADEIQTGIGRTGKFFGFEHIGLKPDVVVLAKAMGGGLPLGAFLGNDRVAEALTYGVHGTTFGGNPVACAAGIAVLEELDEKNLVKHAATIGEYLKSALEKLKTEFPAIVKEVRGHGCMLGVDLHREGQSVVEELQRRGILVNCTHATVLRLLPPLIIQEEHCDRLVKELRSVFGAIPAK